MTNENLKVGDVVSVLLSGSLTWIVTTILHTYGGGYFYTRHTEHKLGNEGVDWQLGIHPSLIPEGFELVESKDHTSNWYKHQTNIILLQEKLEAEKKEIERLRQVVLDCAAYHQGYADKLKDSDPERSKRQQYRVGLLTDFADPKPEDK